jgi:hypothetical protein
MQPNAHTAPSPKSSYRANCSTFHCHEYALSRALMCFEDVILQCSNGDYHRFWDKKVIDFGTSLAFLSWLKTHQNNEFCSSLNSEALPHETPSTMPTSELLIQLEAWWAGHENSMLNLLCLLLE